MKRILSLSALMALLAAAPAMASEEGPFISLHNTEFIVIVAFVLFVAVVLYYRVPKILGEMLDRRASTIRSELEDARQLRDEAQKLLASYKRKQEEVTAQAERIIEAARREAQAAAAQAKIDLDESIARRLASAEEQIGMAEAHAIKDVRDRAAGVAIAVAGEVIAKRMGPAEADAQFETALSAVQSQLH